MDERTDPWNRLTRKWQYSTVQQYHTASLFKFCGLPTWSYTALCTDEVHLWGLIIWLFNSNSKIVVGVGRLVEANK